MNLFIQSFNESDVRNISCHRNYWQEICLYVGSKLISNNKDHRLTVYMMVVVKQCDE